MEKTQEQGRRKDGETDRHAKGQRAENTMEDLQSKELERVRVRWRLLGLKQRVEV